LYAGFGKTQFATAHYKSGMFPLICYAIEGMKNFDASIHNVAIFDDTTFKDLYGQPCFTPQEMIHLFDRATNVTMHARFKDVYFPKGLLRIITHNSGEGIVPQEQTDLFKTDLFK
jgi:hypothetical protein